MPPTQTMAETTMSFIQRERERFYEDTKNMTKDEIMAYIHEGSVRFRLSLQRHRERCLGYEVNNDTN